MGPWVGQVWVVQGVTQHPPHERQAIVEVHQPNLAHTPGLTAVPRARSAPPDLAFTPSALPALGVSDRVSTCSPQLGWAASYPPVCPAHQEPDCRVLRTRASWEGLALPPSGAALGQDWRPSMCSVYSLRGECYTEPSQPRWRAELVWSEGKPSSTEQSSGTIPRGL